MSPLGNQSGEPGSVEKDKEIKKVERPDVGLSLRVPSSDTIESGQHRGRASARTTLPHSVLYRRQDGEGLST